MIFEFRFIIMIYFKYFYLSNLDNRLFLIDPKIFSLLEIVVQRRDYRINKVSQLHN